MRARWFPPWKVVLLLAGALTSQLVASIAMGADLRALSVTGGIPAAPGATRGETFFTAKFDLSILPSSAGVVLSAAIGGAGDTLVDDTITIKVRRPDGTVRKFFHDYSNGCAGLTASRPKDIGHLFGILGTNPGIHKVAVMLKDKCGGYVSASGIALTVYQLSE